jgi:hypothetical protein
MTTAARTDPARTLGGRRRASASAAETARHARRLWPPHCGAARGRWIGGRISRRRRRRRRPFRRRVLLLSGGGGGGGGAARQKRRKNPTTVVGWAGEGCGGLS